mgnify:FL=1
MKIAVYGDSHGAADKKVDSWHTVLGKLLNAEVKTFAIPGSSNLYNYKNFLKHNKNFDLNIFILTGSLKYPKPVEVFDINGSSATELWPSSLAAAEFYRDEWKHYDLDQLSKDMLTRLAHWYIASDEEFMALTSELILNDIEARRPDTVFLTSAKYYTGWENNKDYDTGRNRKEKFKYGFGDFCAVQYRSLGLGNRFPSYVENDTISCHMTEETNIVFAESVKNLIETGVLTPPPETIAHKHNLEYYFTFKG